ncbi:MULTISPECIES: CgeB family protein [Thermodesulfovibrio]|jgi:spore maturation protein CgeB|uniref:CgeB family protein n=1 Tax=Thermodesulfovibrio TaxID=28261 RepID=UPI002626F1CD|nr:glycosyltransferase [Thermodesulfovibrio sp.]
MNILIAGVELVKKDERYMDDKGWSFKKAFEKIGAKVEIFYYKKKGKLSFVEKNKKIKEIWHQYMNKALVTHIKNKKPDIFIILKGETISPETLWLIRKNTDTIIINIYPDNPLYMSKFEAILPCHYFFVKDSYILETLHKAGLKNLYYLPQCTDPDVHKPTEIIKEEKEEYESELSLIGSMYPYREKFIEEIIEFKPAIWGRGWNKSKNKEIIKLYKGKDIRGIAKAKAISASKISLNIHHPLNDIHGVNRRTYDIAGCMGFQLVDYKVDMERVFEINKEIICYRSLDELKKLIEYYLKHPEERKEIAKSAYSRVLKSHTYDIRAKQIMEIIRKT